MAERIFCPRCGKPSDGNVSYCRTCGLALDDVGRIVEANVENKPETRTRPNSGLFRLGLGLFILGMVVALINGAVKEIEPWPQSYGKALFLAMIAARLLFLGASIVFPVRTYRKRRPDLKTDADTNSLTTGPLARELPPAEINNIDPALRLDRHSGPLSVTEGTTRQLG